MWKFIESVLVFSHTGILLHRVGVQIPKSKKKTKPSTWDWKIQTDPALQVGIDASAGTGKFSTFMSCPIRELTSSQLANPWFRVSASCSATHPTACSSTICGHGVVTVILKDDKTDLFRPTSTSAVRDNYGQWVDMYRSHGLNRWVHSYSTAVWRSAQELPSSTS